MKKQCFLCKSTTNLQAVKPIKRFLTWCCNSCISSGALSDWIKR